MRWRKFWLQLHLYIGLTVGLLVSLMGLTGSFLVFSHEVDELLNPQLLQSAPGRPLVSPQIVLTSVQRAYPGHEIQSLFPPQSAGGVYEVWTKGRERQIYVDPSTGVVLGEREFGRSLVGFLFLLHTKLLAGETGEKVVGVGGIALLFLTLTGLYLWWPGKGKVRQAVTVKWRSGSRRITFDLHRAGGFYAAGVLSLIALTGIALVFPDFFTQAIQRVTGTSTRLPNPSLPPPLKGEWLPLDLLLKKAETALPGAVTTRISLPLKPEAPLTVRRKFPQELHPNGMSFVYLDPYRGEALQVENGLHATGGKHLMNLRYPLHIGRYGGVTSRILHVLIGLSPAFLFTTGLLLWWNKKRARKRNLRQERKEIPLDLG